MGRYRHILRRILLSGDVSAYFVLWLAGLRVALAPLDRALAWLERRFLSSAAPSPPAPLVFVVGLPRSGSTYVAQELSARSGLYPLSNAATLFPRSRYLVHRWLRRWRGGLRSVFRHRNFYGIGFGLFAVSNAYEIWDRWYGQEHHRLPASPASPCREDMRDYFSRMSEASGAPILCKNNRNSLIVAELAKLFPRAFFVAVRRDREAVIRSTLRGCRDFFGDSGRYWGLALREFPQARGELRETVGRHVDEVQRHLEAALRALPGDRWMWVDYEACVAAPADVCGEINRRLAMLWGGAAKTGETDVGLSPFPEVAWGA